MPLFMALRGIAGLPLPCPQGDVLPLATGGFVVIDYGQQVVSRFSAGPAPELLSQTSTTQGRLGVSDGGRSPALWTHRPATGRNRG